MQRQKMRIGTYVLDPTRNLLTGEAGEASLEPKVVDVLCTLASRPGEVFSRDELIEAVWHAEFGADERLTRAISHLRKAFGDERGAANYIETVSKRGYRLVANVAAPDLQQTAPVTPPEERTQPPPPNPEPPATRWPASPMVAAGVLAALVLTLVAAVTRQQAATAAANVAQDVIELRRAEVIDGEADASAFAERTHAAVRSTFASSKLNVVERDDAARKPSEFILSGTVEQTGATYAVTLYFNDRQEGLTLWSQRFVRPIADEESLKQSIATIAGSVIACAFHQRTQAWRRPEAAAFMLYLQSCDPNLWADEGEGAIAVAERLSAVAPADAYGHGIAAFANAMMARDRPDLGKAEIARYEKAARMAAARAQNLDPHNAYARLALATLEPGYEYWLALDAFTALSGPTHPWRTSLPFAGGLRQAGRIKEGLRHLDGAVAVAPLSFVTRAMRGVMTMQAGRTRDADRLLDDLLRIKPGDRTIQYYRLVNAAFYGETPVALQRLAAGGDAIEHQDCWRTFLRLRTQGLTEPDVAAMRTACKGFVETDDSGRDVVARMLTALGDVDGAYALLANKSYLWRGSTVSLWYPEMAAFRADPRFMKLVAPSGLPEYWIKSGHWPDYCSDQSLPYDCKTAAAQALN